jgi:hypothetical protein
MNKVRTVHQQAEGFYGVAVVDAVTGKIKRMRSDLDHNLILNSGLDAVYDRSWAMCMDYAVAGTGETPTVIHSGAQTITQTGTVITASGSNPVDFSSQSAGDIIQFFGTNEALITAVNSETSVDVVPSLNNSAATTFSLWKTSDTALAAESKRAGLGVHNTHYVSGTEWCYTCDTGTQRRMRRSWDFSPETSLVRYKELGVSWGPTSGTNLFSRILLDTPEDVDTGERLRMIYQLHVNFGPGEPNLTTANISGWSLTSGTQAMQNMMADSVLNSGTTYDSGTAAGEPFSSLDECRIWLSTNSSAVTSFGTAADRTSPMSDHVQTSKSAFSSGTWVATKTGTFKVHQMVTGSLRSMGVGATDLGSNNSYDSNNQAFAFVFDNNQAKSNTQKLNLGFEYTWGRTLSTENITL